MPAAVGADAMVANLGAQFVVFPDSYQYRVIHIAAGGDAVMTERSDMIRSADGRLHGVPVMGAFVRLVGRINRWTD